MTVLDLDTTTGIDLALEVKCTARDCGRHASWLGTIHHRADGTACTSRSLCHSHKHDAVAVLLNAIDAHLPCKAHLARIGPYATWRPL